MVVGQPQRDQAVLELPAPQLLLRGAVPRPGGLFAVEIEALVLRQIQRLWLLFEQVERIGEPFGQPLLEAVVDVVGRFDIADAQAVIEQFAGPVSGEIRLGLPLLAAFPIPKTATARGTGGRETGILGTTRAAYGCGGTRADSEFGCESTFGALRFVLF